MRSALCVGSVIVALAAGCGSKRTKGDDVNGSGSAVKDAPGKVIGTADGRWLVVRDGEVYSGGKEAVWGQLKRGDDWKMALAPGLSIDGTFVVANRALYWIATPSGALVRTSLPEGPDPTLVVDPKAKQAGRVVASDGTTAFWRADGQLIAAPLTGGAAKVLVASTGDGPILVDGGAVYHATADGIGRIGVDGSDAATVAGAQGAVIEIAASGDRLVWLTADGAVRSAPRAGGDVQELAHGLAKPTGLTVDADHAYVTAGAAILRVSLRGGSPETVVADAGAPIAPLVDHGDLLWIDSREHQVYKRPLAP